MGVYNDLKHSADSKNIEMSVKRSAANSFVLCDEYSVYQSVVNLVDNAIKYTDEGFIEIRLSRDENKNLKIEIEDSGIGISEEYMSNLFEAFSQEETGYSRRFEGTGLGLSLVKNYCDINNIKINVNSEKDSGTIFSLTFNES
jgi:signal transduction histidine kinase